MSDEEWGGADRWGCGLQLFTGLLQVSVDNFVRRPVVQEVLRPLRHLVAYGSTNKYQPVSNCKMSGSAAERPTQKLYFFSPNATKLTMTPSVKAMDSQR